MAALFSKKNVLIDSFAPVYLNKLLAVLGELQIKNVIKGKFPDLMYTPEGYDVSNLSAQDKILLINMLFHLHVNKEGSSVAVRLLESVILQSKDRLGVQKEFDEIVIELPQGVFEREKMKFLPREEVENRLFTCMMELQESRVALDKGVTKRTVDLAAEKDIFEATLNNTSDGVFALNRQGEIIIFNKKMEELTGYSFSEAVNKKADEVVRLFDDTVPLDSDKYNPLIDDILDKNIYSNNKVTLIAKNGVKKYVRLVSAVISEGKDINLGSIVTLTDITKEIELETMKLDFVSIAAHELRTPITSIRGYLELLFENGNKVLDESGKNYLKKVILSADQLYILVENLLNISRIEKGNLVLQKEETDWMQLVNSVAARFSDTAKDQGVEISVIPPKVELSHVLVDKTMMSEVLSNLIDNAIKYNKHGGRVSLIVEKTDTKVTTHVKDTGAGIPGESLPHLFKKFYRTSTSVLTQGKKGTGLGLFISKQIVKLHEGEISVKSTLGEGSTFSFSLPLNQK